jgi:NitT/TauT family transport system permease protein
MKLPRIAEETAHIRPLKYRVSVWFTPIVLAADALLHFLLPDVLQLSNDTGAYVFLLAALFAYHAIRWVLSLRFPGIREKVNHAAPFAIAIAALLGLWDILTVKTGLLGLPYFPWPDKVLGVFVTEAPRLLVCVFYSMRLLITGFSIGLVLGLATGIAIGWNSRFNYWIYPLLKVIGPIPATAWIPLAMVVLPTSFLAGVFLIALAVWFPVTFMTSSGVAGVKNSYLEVARTLGAKESFLIFKVAIPAAYPTIFIGIFMGMGMSFATLIVAEMLGVKAGLGWYINWAQGWGELSKVYASLIVIAVIFSTLLNLLFKLKDRILIWQRGLIKW